MFSPLAFGIDADGTRKVIAMASMGTLGKDFSGMTSGTGMTDSGRIPLRRMARTAARPKARSKVIPLVVIVGAIALFAIVLAPASRTTVAYPDREGGCGCHPYTATSFLTVSGLPVGSYTPGLAYTITVTVADPEPAIGNNSFSLRLVSSAGGGTLTTTDPNAEINADGNASANDLVTPMSTNQWTVVWTAPTSGTVSINVTAVMNQTTIPGTPPKDQVTTTLTDSSAIPEFPAMLIPVVGIGLAVVIAARVTRKAE